MSITIEELVREIHARPVRIVVAVTGGGSQAIADLLRIPGGSRTILEAIVPYSPQSLAQFLRATPEQYCAPQTARAMAMAAFARARELVSLETNSSNDAVEITVERIGIGCTASLASDRPKRGPHRVHIAVQTAASTETASLELAKGARDRAGEEQLAGQLVLDALAVGCDVPGRFAPALLPNEHIKTTRTDALATWQALLLGQTRLVDAHAKVFSTSDNCIDKIQRQIVFPGAFHPLHEAHRRIAELAEKMLAAPMAYEISIENVDKPPLDYTEIATRVSQFAPHQRVWLTRAPTFVEKSRLFPGCTFLAGADTVARIADPRYYNNDFAQRDNALREIADHGCHFLVYGRVIGQNFVMLESLALPAVLQSVCRAVPADVFRMDISSTQLRKEGESDD